MGGDRLLARATTGLGLGPGGPPGRALTVLAVALVAAVAVASLTSPSRSGGEDRPGLDAGAAAGATEAPQAGEARGVDPIGLGRAAPVRLVIEQIDVDVRVVPLRLGVDGLSTPPVADAAGWYEGGTSPGEIGSAVIIGQVADPKARPGTAPAAFGRLDRLAEGDRIDVVRADGATASFTVERIAPYSATERYRNLDAQARLRLVGTGASRRAGPELVVFATARDQAARG